MRACALDFLFKIKFTMLRLWIYKFSDGSSYRLIFTFQNFIFYSYKKYLFYIDNFL